MSRLIALSALSLSVLLGVVLLAADAPKAEPAAAKPADTLVFHARRRVPDKSVETKEGYPPLWTIESRRIEWNPRETAVVICDMWDDHWCKGAAKRCGEMAPAVNEAVKRLRERGVLVIHCPSSCMQPYEGTKPHATALAAKKVETKVPLQPWCRIDPKSESKLPVDDSDGGCDCTPHCPHGSPWRRQHAAIEIKEEDAITDSAQAYYLMRERGIKNAIICGVHANMCVLGRPFSIRQLVYQGMNVVLLRDLTDSMYNHEREPKVPHHRGTELIVEHIEKYWCPTATSSDLTGQAPWRFADDARKHIVFLVNKQEYHSEDTMPAFAQELADKFNYSVNVICAEPGKGFVGTDGLKKADLIVLFARREPISETQLADLKAYLASGKPLVGLRTASHAFGAKGDLAPGFTRWETIDPEILGGSYKGHGPEGSKVLIPAAMKDNPLLAGVEPWESSGSLYNVSPIDPAATVLLTGTNRDGTKPEPVAWTRMAGKSRVFYTSLGHPDDLKVPAFRKLLVNGVQWALGN